MFVYLRTFKYYTGTLLFGIIILFLDGSHPLHAGDLSTGVDEIYIPKVCTSTGQMFLGAPRNVHLSVSRGMLSVNKKVKLTTSNSRVFPLPSSLEFLSINADTYVNIREPSTPSLVIISASMLPFGVDRKSYQLMVYPPIKIMSFKLSPQKNLYHVGDRVKATVKLNFIPPKSTDRGIELSIGVPKLNDSQNNQGINFNINKKTWHLSNRGENAKVFSQTFTIPSWFARSKPFSNRSSVSYGLETKLINEGTVKMGGCYGISADDTNVINFSVKNNTLPSMTTPKLRRMRKPKR